MIEATEEGSSRNILLNVYFVDTMITIYIYICIYMYVCIYIYIYIIYIIKFDL